MDESPYWLFSNIKKQMHSRKMSQAKAELLIKKLSPEEINDWQAWTSIFRDWLPLKNLVIEKDGIFELMIQLKNDFVDEAVNDETINIDAAVDVGVMNKAEFIGDQLTLSGIPRPPSFKSFLEKEFVDGNILKLQNRKGGRVNKEIEVTAERRGAARYEVKVEVLILAKGLSFRAETINLSQTGALLSKPLPDAFAGVPLEVVFILKTGKINEKLVLKGKVLSTRQNLRHLTFSNITSEGINFFERLIKNQFQAIS